MRDKPVRGLWKFFGGAVALIIAVVAAMSIPDVSRSSEEPGRGRGTAYSVGAIAVAVVCGAGGIASLVSFGREVRHRDPRGDRV